MDKKGLKKRIEIPGFELYDQWLHNNRNHKKIDQFFQDNSFNSIAIYGMGRIGEQFYAEMMGSRIELKYGIDINADKIFVDDLKIIKPERIPYMKNVDAIVVTPIQYFNEIENMILNLGFAGEVISIRQVVDYAYRY